MLGLLPNCFRLTVSEPDEAGRQDYILEHADVELPTSDEILRLASPDAASKKLQLRQLAFHSALFKLAQQRESSPQPTLADFGVPRAAVESIQSLQKKQKAKIVGGRVTSSRSAETSKRKAPPRWRCRACRTQAT